MSIDFKAVGKEILGALVFAAKNPATVKKATYGAAATVLADIAAFSTVLQFVPPQIATAISAVQAVATFITVYLAPKNAVPSTKAG